MAKDLAIVLNSGSVNSAVLTALAAQKHRPVLLYAEMSAGVSRGKQAYDLQVQHFKPYREHALAMPFLSAITTPKETGPVVDPRLPVSVTQTLVDLVPLVATAARYAAFYQAAAIYVGVRLGTAGDEIARVTEYAQIWNELLQMPCGLGELTVETPLLELEPWQVVDVGFQVGAPMDRTWSCNGDGPEPCGICRGCKQREAAFMQAGRADPMKVVRKV